MTNTTKTVLGTKGIRNLARKAGSAVKPFAKRLAVDATALPHLRQSALEFLARKCPRHFDTIC